MGWNKKTTGNSGYVSIDEKRPEFKGVLRGFQQNKKYPDKRDFVFELPSGKRVIVNSSALLTEAITEVGAAYHIIFKGREPSKKGQPTKVYDIYEAKDEDVVKAFLESNSVEAQSEEDDDDDLPF